MRRLSIYFLAFLTFWMSTWMVTDIHDFSIAEEGQSYLVFSGQQLHVASDNHLTDDDHNHDLHCGVCSYDHGGHIGQALATLPFVAETIPAQNSINYPLNSGFWYSRNTSPKLRPPIA